MTTNLSRRTVIQAFTASVVTGALAGRALAQSLLHANDALSLLRSGALNIYMRHGITDRSQSDTGRRGDRMGQRNLSAEGERQATALGHALRKLGVPVAEVLTSEVFRAQDTARLAFGEVSIHPALIADDYTAGDPRDDAAQVSSLLAKPTTGGNRILVGHIAPLGIIMGRSFSQAEFPEGSLALFRPEGSSWRFLGVVSAETVIGAAS